MSPYRGPKKSETALALPAGGDLDAGRFDTAASSMSTTSGAPAKIGWLMFWMTGVLLSFVFAAVSVRALSPTFSAFEMMSVRNAGGLLVLVVLALVRPELRKGLAPRRMGLQTVRSVVHFISQICWTLAITLLPFATVFALEFTIPAWVALLAVLFLGERMTAARAGALVICFIGVLVILRPGFEAFQPAALLVLCAAFAFAITAIMTKKLITTETTFAILFWMNLIQLPLNLAGSDPLFFTKINASMTLPLLGIALAGLSVHYCLTNAFRCGDAIIVIPMDFLRVPLIAVIGWMFYDEHPDVFVFAGAALIVAGVLWNVRAEAVRSRTASPSVAPIQH